MERLEPWHNNRLKRLVKTPKLHLGDTGLACALLGVDPKALRADWVLLGQLVETFAYQELRRQAGWHDSPLRFFHYRDKDGAEVDIVIERGAGLVAGIEVKAGGTVTNADFRGLRKLASATGERFVAGVVLYDGEIAAGFATDSAPFRSAGSGSRHPVARRRTSPGYNAPFGHRRSHTACSAFMIHLLQQSAL